MTSPSLDSRAAAKGMGGAGPAESEEALLRRLLAQAEEQWGPERLEALRPMIVQTARHLWEISCHPPELEDEPAFFA